MKRLSIKYLAIAVFLIITGFCAPALGQAEQVFKTGYTNIHYNNDKDLSDFLWRLGGTRIDIMSDRELASSRVDRIIDRVQAILDMRPKALKIDIYLSRGDLKYNKTAYYKYENKAIYISVDKMSDGVFAHEVSHAIINQYFTMPTPSKLQEIITQYVDKYLWSDY